MSTATTILPSRQMLSFQLYDWLGLSRRLDVETLGAVLDTAERLSADAFLACYRSGDANEPWQDADGAHVLPEVRDALTQYAELGLPGLSFAESLGGFGFSFVPTLAVQAFFAAANSPLTAYTVLTAANARLIASCGTPAQIEQFAKPQIAGRWFGTMCLSEPHAGSSLGDILTRAVPDGHDTFGDRYRISGNKMWITGGDHDIAENIVHLVLAKVARQDGSLPEGSKGISLFIVPRILPDGTRNDVALAGLNHKLGNRAAVNCLLNFGENQGAIGWRVGAEGQGLPQMFMMMNEARIGVGLSAAALGYRGYRESLNYARERTQGRPIGRTGGAPVPIIEHPDVRRMLLQQKTFAEGALSLCFYCANLVDQKSSEAETLLALLTPVAKSWPSEFGLVANDAAIQIHGGYGYTRDFAVEQVWRDNRLNPIHEGTTGIQAIDLLGRKLLQADGSGLALLRGRIADTAKRAQEEPTLSVRGQQLLDYWQDVAATIEGLRQRGPAAFDDATLFLRAFGHGVMAWLWLDQALAAVPLARAGYAVSVAAACHYMFESELPQAEAWLRVVSRQGSMVRDMSLEVFA